MTSTAPIDARELRNALGAFTTGVTVITTVGEGGEDLGITVNSFSSVSLDPPLVLWSIGKDAQSYEGFITAEYFNIHVLSEGQEHLSNRFASQVEDKFAGLEIARDKRGLPVLAHCAARLDCSTEFHYEGGDHTIIVGEVVGFEYGEQPPLVFHRGRYCRLDSGA